MLVVVAAFLGVVAAAPAAEAAGYRYWSYWLKAGDGPWTYAQTGPAMHVPKDGAVEGWRFAVSKDAADTAAQPRGTADFATICAATPAREGMKRIALVIDAGTAADAPGGEAPPEQRTACARVAKNASSADALATVARPLRYDSAGILCAIAGYPATGCGEQVSGTTHTSTGASTDTNASAKRKSGGPSVGVYAGVAAVVVLAGAAVWQTRRRRP
ncbi:SCO2322 family protein [Actinacidiphila alni]|uniref:SCO2322 family protein n=1 Tax=Actinacidiphila alni TaxID=380248 RepID=UPI0033D48ED1